RDGHNDAFCGGNVGEFILFCFFFQAEDGIRDSSVTGVQTCALPIYTSPPRTVGGARFWVGLCSALPSDGAPVRLWLSRQGAEHRSEERRVGKEGRSGWRTDHYNKTKMTEALAQSQQRSEYTSVPQAK